MTATEARAPGKLFLTGEYSVLCGMPALVAASEPASHILNLTLL